jgi:membrane associated rhomboid family serine protease
MVSTPVGIRCPECGGRRTAVRSAGFAMARSPNLVYAILAANLLLFPLTNQIGGGLLGGRNLNELGADLAVSRATVADGEWWRLITCAFIHIGPVHLAFNMFMLWILGGAFERYAGPLRFGAVYAVSALGGSFGALLLTPGGATAGASGAIFGLMGCLFVLERQRGLSLVGGSIAPLLAFNLVFSFAPGVSLGGHLGGLIAGVLAGLVLSAFGRGHLVYGRLSIPVVAGLLALGAGAVAGALVVAG